MVMQVRAPDPSGQNARGVWASPARDIAHCFPIIVRRALEATEEDIKTPEQEKQMCKYAKAAAKFVTLSVDAKGPVEVADAFRESGLFDMTEDACNLFNKWFARVMFSVYFKGVHEATHPGETALGIKELMELEIVRDNEEK